MMRSKPRGRLSGLASASIRPVVPLLIVAVCLLVAFQFGLPRFLDTRLSDARFVFGERPASGTIVLVDIDAASLSEVGVWPWPRRLHADLPRVRLDQVADLRHARVVGTLGLGRGRGLRG